MLTARRPTGPSRRRRDTLRGRAGVLLAAVMILAGCVGAAPRPLDEAAPEGAAVRDDDGAPVEAPDPEQASDDVFLGASCEVFGLVIYTTQTLFRADYPGGVEGFHNALVSAGLKLLECRQLVYPDHVTEGFQLATLTTLITTPTGGDGAVSNLFVHQAYTNDPVFANFTSTRYGWDVVLMDTVRVDLTTNPVRGQAFEMRIPPTDPHYVATGMVDLQGSGSVHERFAYVFASEDDGLGYYVLDYRGRGNTASPGALEAFDGSYWAPRALLPGSHATTIHDFDLEATFTFQTIEPRESLGQVVASFAEQEIRGLGED